MATVPEIFAEYDKLAVEKDDKELIDWLVEQTNTFITEHPNDLLSQSALFSEIGGFYRSRRAFDASESAFLHAKTLLESIGDTKSGNYATVLNNLAGLYRLMEQYEKAITYFDAAIDIYETLENLPATIYASAFNNKGLVYQDMEDYDNAGQCFGAALEILIGAPNTTLPLATTYSNFAFCCFAEGNVESACNFMNMAVEHYGAVLSKDDPMYQQCVQIRDAMENAKNKGN